MSGEGLLADRPEGLGGSHAVDPDVIAYLRQRRDNAALMARKAAELEPLAQDRARQLEVIIADLEAGLHEGSAAVREKLADGI